MNGRNQESGVRRQKLEVPGVILSEAKSPRAVCCATANLCRVGEKPLGKLGVTTLGIAFALCVYCSSAFAASVSSPSTIDSGGLRTTSANYTMDGSVGGIGGISSAAPDTAKNGYVGELAEVVSITVTSTPDFMNENATSQLRGTAMLDDSTVSALAGSDIAWAGALYPLTSIDGSGLATAASVYATTNGAFNGFYLGGSGSGILEVIDSNPDNYGSYAGDGIPDSWQSQYFGLNNPNAAPNKDVDGTGQNNLFKFVAGLDPTNPASIFVLKIAAVNGQPNQKNLIYNPIAGGRTYSVESRTNLHSGSYAALGSFNGPQTNGAQATVTDLNATPSTKFYHVHISLP